jgi:hypothetical protein
LSVAKARLNPLQQGLKKEKSVAKARLYLISTNKMAEILDRDMRQGPSMCGCPLGFKSTNYNHKCKRNNATTIQLRSFAEIYLHLTKKSSSKP